MKKVEVSEMQGPLTELMNQIGGENGRCRFDEFKLWLKRVPGDMVEVAPDTIHVDRSVRPNYPSWILEAMHPELEGTGPDKFETKSLQLWFHPSQTTGVVKGRVIYAHLYSEGMLESCLGLRDLEEIQKKGIAHFRKHFQGKDVFGWKSVVRDHVNLFFVPYLIGISGKVVLSWDSFDAAGWGSRNPALRFADK